MQKTWRPLRQFGMQPQRAQNLRLLAAHHIRRAGLAGAGQARQDGDGAAVRLQSAAPRPRWRPAWPGISDRALPASRWSIPPCRSAPPAARHAPCPRAPPRRQNGRRNRAPKRPRLRRAPAHGLPRRTDKAASRLVPQSPAMKAALLMGRFFTEGTGAALSASFFKAWPLSAPPAGASLRSTRRISRARHHLERYARRLSAAEINSSFYRPHQRKTYERWAASVPDDFRFASSCRAPSPMRAA